MIERERKRKIWNQVSLKQINLYLISLTTLLFVLLIVTKVKRDLQEEEEDEKKWSIDLILFDLIIKII